MGIKGSTMCEKGTYIVVCSQHVINKGLCMYGQRRKHNCSITNKCSFKPNTEHLIEKV